MSENPILNSVESLRFDLYRPDQVGPALEAAEQLAWERIEALLTLPGQERTATNTLLALHRAQEELEAVVGISAHLMSTLGGEWNEPAQLAIARASAYSNEISFHEGIYQALLELSKRSEHINAQTPQMRKLLKETIRDYERNGINLAPGIRARLKQVRAQLDEATNLFDQNVVTASDAAGLALDSQSQLEGLEPDFIAGCKEAAKAHTQANFWVDFTPPNYIKVMTNCRCRDTRQAMYRLSITRAENLNKELAHKILKLRRELAHLLGYKTYADYALEERMAGTGAVARKFIADLIPAYRELGNREYLELEQFAREAAGDPDLLLDAADIDSGLDFYYAERLHESRSKLKYEEIKQYFPMPSVREFMFRSLEMLYGVRFKEAQHATWHEQVEVYEIYDEANAHIATAWCDWYARKGKKSGAWMNSHYVAERANGVINKPHLGYVCANFEPPQGDRPSLLSIRDVETMWHEFGHFMHLALGKTQLPEQSMMSCKWDFVEAPSQIMENWVWCPEVLAGMARHYKTNEPLDESVIAALIKDRNFMVGTKAMRQFALAEVDLALHIDFDPEKEDDVVEFVRREKARFLPVDIYPEDASITTFSHIFSGGYAAGYYSYKWAEAIEADLFSRFQAEGVLNPKTGRAYRDCILARGDETEPQDLVGDFLGRSSNLRAMLERDGVPDGGDVKR